jgi:CRP/FNR family transcriptional regulator
MASLSANDYLNKYFPQFELALKEKLAQHTSIKIFETGELMMQPGQYFRSTMLVVEGKVKLYRQGEDGGEFFMYYLEPGNACALSLICATKQETSEVMAKAVEKTTVLSIPIEIMDDLVRNYKTWYYFTLETYRNRFEELLQVIDSVAFKGLDERLMFYLKKQAEKLNTKQLPLTHQEIAADLNSSREVISRLLKKIEQRGDVILHRNYVEWLK